MTDSLSGFHSQVGNVFYAGAEASWTHERAIRAGEASVGNMVPARVLLIAVQQVANVGDVQGSAHCPGRSLDAPPAFIHVLGGCWDQSEATYQVSAWQAAGTHDKDLIQLRELPGRRKREKVPWIDRPEARNGEQMEWQGSCHLALS